MARPRGHRGRRAGEVDLPDLRRALAAAVAHAARRLWRRSDIEEADEVVLDLLTEALCRWGHLYGPRQGGASAAAAVQSAPQHVRALVSALLPVAARAEATPEMGRQRPAEDGESFEQQVEPQEELQAVGAIAAAQAQGAPGPRRFAVVPADAAAGAPVLLGAGSGMEDDVSSDGSFVSCDEDPLAEEAAPAFVVWADLAANDSEQEEFFLAGGGQSQLAAASAMACGREPASCWARSSKAAWPGRRHRRCVQQQGQLHGLPAYTFTCSTAIGGRETGGSDANTITCSSAVSACEKGACETGGSFVNTITCNDANFSLLRRPQRRISAASRQGQFLPG